MILVWTTRTHRAVTVGLATFCLSGIASAQQTTPPPTPVAPPAPIQVPAQPSAPTPPTPLPERPPATDPLGVRPADVQPTQAFRALPGQPQPGDPPAIRSLSDALATAFQRNPNVLLAAERAFSTTRTVDQILALQRPQIGVSASYARLSGANATGAVGGGGVSPSQVQNPFPVGLQITPPGSIPITLSGGAGTGAGGGAGSAGATPPGGSGQLGGGNSIGTTAGTSRAADMTAGTSRAAGATRQGNPQGQGGGGGFELNQQSARVSVSQLVDITGVVRAAVQVGELGEALSRLELARVRQDLALNVRNGFYNVLRSEAFVRVNEAAVAQSEEQLRVTQAQRDAGVASDFDVLRARTQLDNNRQALISARNQVNIGKNAFANLLGIDPSTPINPEVPDVPALPALGETPLLEQALRQRPEYLQADTNILLARKNTRLARRNLEPYVNVNLSGVLNGTSGVPSDDRASAAVGVTLTVPLYDGGATRAAVESARSGERQSLIQKDQFVRGIKAEVQQAIIAVRDANERTSVAGQTVTQAREALRLANVRFRAGVGTQLEINDAQTALTQAETNEVNARYDYLSALARLSRAVGNPE